jgi:UDP-glucose 4-epimerase
VAIFGALMKSGQRPKIFGDGTKARDYVYVGDVAAANLAALTKGKNIITNIGRGVLVTDKQIFDVIANACNFKEKPIYAPYRAGETYRISLDANKAKKILGWKPKMSLEEGVRKAVENI